MFGGADCAAAPRGTTSTKTKAVDERSDLVMMHHSFADKARSRSKVEIANSLAIAMPPKLGAYDRETQSSAFHGSTYDHDGFGWGAP